MLKLVAVAIAVAVPRAAVADDVLWRTPSEDEPVTTIGDLVVFRWFHRPHETNWVELETGRTAKPPQPFSTWDAGGQLVHEESLSDHVSFRVFATEGGKKLWETVVRPPRVGPVVVERRALFVDEDRVFALDSASGVEAWHVNAPHGGRFFGVPRVVDGVVLFELEFEHRRESRFVDLADGAPRGQLPFLVLDHVVSSGELLAIADTEGHRGLVDVKTAHMRCELADPWRLRSMHAIGSLLLLHWSSGVLEGRDRACKIAFRTGVAGDYSLVREHRGRRVLVHTTDHELVARDLDKVAATPPQRRVFRGTVRASAGAPSLTIELGDQQMHVGADGSYRIETSVSGFLRLSVDGGDEHQRCSATRVLELERAPSRQDLTVTCEKREENE